MFHRDFTSSTTREVQIDGRTKTVTRFLASTDGESRDGHIILQAGWKTEAYRKNPVVLWAHDSSRPPIGRGVRVEVTGDGLEIDVEWDEGNPLGALVARQYRDGFLKACSVGWDPVDYQPRSMLDKDDPHYAASWGFVFRKQELLELSACPVGADPRALARAGLPSATGIEVMARASLLEALDAPEVQEAIRSLVAPTVTEVIGTLNADGTLTPISPQPAQPDPDTEFWRAVAAFNRE